MLSLLALVLLNAAPANPPAPGPESFRKTKDFQEWSGGRFVFDERWVELPQAGLRVGYFLVPKPGSPAGGAPPFEDAFFVVDTRKGGARRPGRGEERVPQWLPGAGRSATAHRRIRGR